MTKVNAERLIAAHAARPIAVRAEHPIAEHAAPPIAARAARPIAAKLLSKASDGKLPALCPYCQTTARSAACPAGLEK